MVRNPVMYLLGVCSSKACVVLAKYQGHKSIICRKPILCTNLY